MCRQEKNWDKIILWLIYAALAIMFVISMALQESKKSRQTDPNTQNNTSQPTAKLSLLAAPTSGTFTQTPRKKSLPITSDNHIAFSSLATTRAVSPAVRVVLPSPDGEETKKEIFSTKAQKAQRISPDGEKKNLNHEAHEGHEDLKLLLDSIALVESDNQSAAVGDGGAAVGMYQLHPLYVKDVNRILGKERFTLKDRLSPVKSRLMVTIYLRHYGRGHTLLEMARIHNGGPQGFRRAATLKYAEKIQEQLRILTAKNANDANENIAA